MRQRVLALSGLAALLCAVPAAFPGAAEKPAVVKKEPAQSKEQPAEGLATGSGPLEVYADNGLELEQDAKLIIARGNAKAVRGAVTVYGDVLIAHYRDKQTQGSEPAPKVKAPKEAPAKQDEAAKADGQKDNAADPTGGNSEVWRVEADGNVRIASTTQTAYGDHADYNIDDKVVVLTGTNLRMVTPTDVITARDMLEYHEDVHKAVARGNAVAVRTTKNDRIQADVLVADFEENDQKKMVIVRAHGYDHVILTTPTEIVTGDRADYRVETGIVTVTGVVRLTRGPNQLNGGYAVCNLNTGVDRLYPAPPGKAEKEDKQVKGLLVPQKGRAAEASSQPAPQPVKEK